MFKNKKVEALYNILGLKQDKYGYLQFKDGNSGFVSTRAYNILANDLRAITDHLGVEIQRQPQPLSSDGFIRSVVKKGKHSDNMPQQSNTSIAGLSRGII